MPELRSLLHQHAVTPRADLDVDALLGRARRGRLRARVAAWLAALAALGAIAIPVGQVLTPASPSRPVRTVNPKPGNGAPTTVPGSVSAAPPAAGGRSTASVATGPATPPTIAGTPVPPATAPPTTAPTLVAAGHRIAFVGTDGTIDVVDADGSAKRSLGPGLDPAWSPDGSRIAFWRGTGDTSGCENDPGINQAPPPCTGDVWVMKADGSQAHLVVSNGMKPAWSPDGRRLAYSTAEPAAAGLHELFVANADGTAPRRLTSGFSDTAAKWSPDGRTIVFARCCVGSAAAAGPELYAIAPDGTNLRHVWGTPDLTAWGPAWSPDGGRIAFTGYNYGANKVSIYVLDLATDSADQITQGPAGPTWVDNMDYAPAWSPDGRRIAYVHDADGASGTGNCDAGPTTGCAMGGSQPGVIYLVNPDGSGRARLADGAWPAFEP
jgi:Tol biopolymer transport system component